MSAMMYQFGQNFGFGTSICVVDGTKIQISRPTHHVLQHWTWSVKKHQHSLNMLIITKLNDEIIYFSPIQVSTNDQKQWKSLGLHSLFLGKGYGILGDGGFTFNKATDPQRI